MNKLFVITLLLFASLAACANKIDELKTDSDVVRFLISLDKKFTKNKYTPKLIIRPIDSIFTDTDCFKHELLSKSWRAKSWQKVDLNNDKYTDLVVTVYWYSYENYVVMDTGNGTFKLISLRYSIEFCELVNIIRYNNKNLVVFHGIDTDLPNTFFHPRTDTLIYKFDRFVELNEHPPEYEIDSLILDARGCFGSCPIFKLKINGKGKMRFDRDKTLNPQRINQLNHKIIKYKKRGKLSSDERQELFELISYINFKKLRSRYAVPWTDDLTGVIRIRFKDGSTKTIEDYGEKGTFGLQMLFSKLYAISKAKRGI